MADKAKVKIKGYFTDLRGWFSLPKRREAWIETGNPKLDTSDPIAELAAKLHPGTIHASIVATHRETPTSQTFTLAPLKGSQLPAFHAGQYLSVKFTIDGKTLTRPFAISSAPYEALENGRLDITFKVKPGGYASEYIQENWHVGTELVLDAPFGHIYYNGIRDSAHIVGIAGGSGVTIFRSLIKEMLHSGDRPDRLTLLFGSRNSSDILYRKELDELATAAGGRVTIIHVLSEPEDDWTGEKGFITAELIGRLVPDYAEASFYVSGPAALYDFIEPELDKLNISPMRRRIECYGESDNIVRHPDFPGQADKTYTLTVLLGVDRREVVALSTETIAVALERAGLAIDTRCRSGECGWCRSRLESGRIWQRPQSDGVRARDKDVGYFHPCSAYPLEDITVRVFTRL
ncbi:MAG: iron-sulfur cluster-binding domain-containing protein [Coriobacteriales bacterium]|jgi:ferredoxin-NADP reductase|nr:iron-sulfur cluster-binding domain-containing protein [Coriobacteriales bacterium]